MLQWLRERRERAFIRLIPPAQWRRLICDRSPGCNAALGLGIERDIFVSDCNLGCSVLNRLMEVERTITKSEEPGVVLGPYESLISLIMYMNELTDRKRWNRFPDSRLSARVKNKFRVPFKTKERILLSYLLFGKMDVMAGRQVLNKYLQSQGCPFSSREFFGDFGPLRPEPFSHPIESSQIVRLVETSTIDPNDVHPIVPEIVKTMRYAGIMGTKFWDGDEYRM